MDSNWKRSSSVALFVCCVFCLDLDLDLDLLAAFVLPAARLRGRAATVERRSAPDERDEAELGWLVREVDDPEPPLGCGCETRGRDGRWVLGCAERVSAEWALSEMQIKENEIKSTADMNQHESDANRGNANLCCLMCR